jgi:AcrR family transcriptional regulator
MRITAQAQAETRERIVQRAQELFVQRGYAATTTRDLARAAGIAAGTLFNYFGSKEALALELFNSALKRGHAGWRTRRHGGEDLAEDLFALIAAELRELEPLRALVGDVLEEALSPLARNRETSPGEDVRVNELELVAELFHEHAVPDGASPVSMHLYWTLWYGVLAFYASDDSSAQEDSLAVLDRSMRLFTASLVQERTPSTNGDSR